MSPIKRSDVESHVHSPFLARIHLVQSESQPDATGFSGSDLETIEASPSGFAEDFVAEHSSSCVAVAQTEQVTDSGSQQAPAASKGVQK